MAHEFTFYVDDDPVTGTEHDLTVRQILELSNNVPPEEFILHEFRGQSSQEVPHENLDEVVHLHPNLRFAALARGGTPLS